ncbi:Imm49 family immunity protein [uncultured Lacinutrix sp.]|uniref:Imm49 family immunity protein n=1 Tax=uncultured Lacinutrix sp. TaxID=574032 RepID=UPI00262CD0D5|nr:Imm49 family immunity protein [uncultured Lacinutrix sp.]
MITLQKAFDKTNERQIKYLDAIQNNPKHNILRIASTLRSDCVSKFLYYFFEENNINKAKQSIYSGQKLLEFINKWDNFKYFPTQINNFYFLFSDSNELIKNFIEIDIDRIPSKEFRLTNGHTLGYVIQEILKDNKEKALELLDVFEKKHKNYALKEQDAAILKAIIEGDKKGVEELLEFFLLPKNHNKSPDKGMISHKLISYEATVYAKLAWIKSIEVDIDHPLLPKELLPIKPNKEYIIEYDFLKPDYKPNIKTKQEKPKPNAEYRKDIPKNKIEVNKSIIQGLIQQNWEAKYSKQELEDNTNIIYAAFTNPQEFDKTNYAFAKLGSYHISHSDEDFIYIESKPFTNMWTSMKNELDYFFEVINVCFDIMGIKLVDGEQYDNLKKELEIKQNNTGGFFKKLFNKN